MRSLSCVACLAGAFAGAMAMSRAATAAAASQAVELRPAPESIRAAVLDRVGQRAEVTVRAIDPDVMGVFRDARPDPAAVLGKPIKFTLIPERGAAVLVVATVDVVVDHATARQTIARGHTIGADDLEARRAELIGIPLRAAPTVPMLTGARALRPIPAGSIVLANTVAMRRAIEPGDPVTVVAVSGAVEVSATFVAADGGPLGATIRVLNPETRRLIRGRIVGERLVEVIHGR